MNQVAMVTPEQILEFVDGIAREFQPERVILFGSYAYGRPTEDSDVDLLVVMPYTRESFRKATEIRLRLVPTFSVDLLVRNSAELRQRLEWNDFFLKEVTEKGTVLHDATNARMGREGRRRLQRRALVATRP